MACKIGSPFSGICVHGRVEHPPPQGVLAFSRMAEAGADILGSLEIGDLSLESVHGVREVQGGAFRHC